MRQFFRSNRKKAIISCPRNSMAFVAIKMGRQRGGPSRTGGKSGASAAVDRPVFIATPRAAAGPLRIA
jgi:hypothetical protein